MNNYTVIAYEKENGQVPILPEYCISFTMIIKLFLQMDLLRKLKRLPGRKLN